MENLRSQVRKLMLDHEWRTIEQLAIEVNAKPETTSATMRVLRKPKHGGFHIEKQYVNGEWQYRIAPPAMTNTATPAPDAPKPAPTKIRKAPYTDPTGLTIGQIIRGRRTQLFLTQTQLAEVIGVSPSTINAWEIYNAQPRLSTIKPLCDALGISPDTLRAGKTRPKLKTGRKPQPKTAKANTASIDINALALAIAEALKKAST